MSGADRVPGAGPLRNGNHRGDPNGAPRCAARTRSGGPCRSPAMTNGRCRMHGGASTGPRTEAGRERSRAANLVHGYRTTEAREQHRQARVPIQAVTAYVALLRGKALKPESARPWPRLRRNAPPSGGGHPQADRRSAAPASESAMIAGRDARAPGNALSSTVQPAPTGVMIAGRGIYDPPEDARAPK